MAELRHEWDLRCGRMRGYEILSLNAHSLGRLERPISLEHRAVPWAVQNSCKFEAHLS